MPKAAIFTGPDRPFEIREYPLTPPAAGMACSRLIASGICGTDIHIHRGKLGVPAPMMIGHEFVGEITGINESGSDQEKSGLQPGDRVIACIAVPCGQCPLCLAGDDANCVRMALTNSANPEQPPHFVGGYGEYNYTPIKNLIKIPPSLDPQAVCVFACAGPTALHAFGLAEKAGVRIEEVKTAVIQGLGPVGMFAVMWLASMGVSNIAVITFGDNPRREQMALSFGATRLYNLNRQNVGEITADILAESGGLGADLVFEASGNPQAVPQGMAFLRNRGVYLVPGQYSNSGEVSISPQLITFKALHLIGSSQYSLSDIDRYLAFMAANPQLAAPIRSLAACYRVADINIAIQDAKSGANIKTMLTLDRAEN